MSWAERAMSAMTLDIRRIKKNIMFTLYSQRKDGNQKVIDIENAQPFSTVPNLQTMHSL